MKLEDIHPVLREALGIHEAFRKCGFPSEEIFVALNPPATFLSMFDPNYARRSILVILKTQDKEFSVNVGYIDLKLPEWEKTWTALCLAVINHEVTEEDLDVIWQSCMAFQDKVGFVTAISDKGIDIPGPKDLLN